MVNDNEHQFNFKITKDLIEKVHEPMVQKKFRDAEGHHIVLQKIWIKLRKELKFSEKLDIEKKYNSLFSKYKLEKKLSNTSGEAPSTWRYYDIFDSTIPVEKKLSFEDVVEIGTFKDIVPENEQKKIKKSTKTVTGITKNEMNEKRAKVYDLLIESMAKEKKEKKNELELELEKKTS